LLSRYRFERAKGARLELRYRITTFIFSARTTLATRQTPLPAFSEFKSSLAPFLNRAWPLSAYAFPRKQPGPFSAYTRQLRRLYQELGVRGAIDFIRNSCAAPWLDPARMRVLLAQPFLLQLE